MLWLANTKHLINSSKIIHKIRSLESILLLVIQKRRRRREKNRDGYRFLSWWQQAEVAST
jgi:hypothetical protein